MRIKNKIAEGLSVLLPIFLPVFVIVSSSWVFDYILGPFAFFMASIYLMLGIINHRSLLRICFKKSFFYCICGAVIFGLNYIWIMPMNIQIDKVLEGLRVEACLTSGEWNNIHLYQGVVSNRISYRKYNGVAEIRNTPSLFFSRIDERIECVTVGHSQLKEP